MDAKTTLLIQILASSLIVLIVTTTVNKYKQEKDVLRVKSEQDTLSVPYVPMDTCPRYYKRNLIVVWKDEKGRCVKATRVPILLRHDKGTIEAWERAKVAPKGNVTKHILFE